MFIRARLKFEKIKPDFFLKNNFTAFDMHYHTRYSDGKVNVREIAKKCERLNIGVAITDHNEIRGAIEIANYDNVKSIPGIELTSNEGVHLLAYFYDIKELSDYYNHHVLGYKRPQSIFLKKGINDILKDLSNYVCLTVAAHPYAPTWTGICKPYHSEKINVETIKSLGGIEVINGENTRNGNLKAIDLAESLNMPIVGGSDGHTIIELGKVITYVKHEVNPEKFLEEIKKDNTYVVGKEHKKISMVLASTTKTRTIGFTQIKRSVSYLKSKIKLNK